MQIFPGLGDKNVFFMDKARKIFKKTVIILKPGFCLIKLKSAAQLIMKIQISDVFKKLKLLTYSGGTYV
jgi:hypothetical protein